MADEFLHKRNKRLALQAAFLIARKGAKEMNELHETVPPNMDKAERRRELLRQILISVLSGIAGAVIAMLLFKKMII